MADQRLTPWQRAKADSQTFQGVGRRAVVPASGAALALVIQALLDWPGGPVLPVVITVGSGILAAGAFAIGELLINWWRAPIKLLTDDVIAIRERLESLPTLPTKPPQPQRKPITIRLALLEHLRFGREIADNAGVKWRGDTAAIDGWTSQVVTLLNDHVSGAEAEKFVKVTTLAGRDGLVKRIEALEAFIKERWPDDT